MTIQEKVRQIRNGTLSSVKLCEECLERIAANDKTGKGLNAVAAIDPNWYYEASALDNAEDRETSDKPLYGIPILLKDNIEVKGMANTAGSYVLRDLIADDDAYVVRKLREAGAVILGKANLSEFAYWMSEDDMPSGYSSLNGQVVHPYNPKYDPSGSSSGSAVAVAARYCDATIGTETDGSLMSPAISNGIVSIKPSVGLVSRNGILPLSEVQDTAGPMANCVEDCALLLQVMASLDPNDPYSYRAQVHDYLKELEDDLSGKRIGVFTVKDQEHNEEYLELLKKIITDHHGEVYEFVLEEALIEEYPCLFNEFKNGINKYLSDKYCVAHNLKDIIELNEKYSERCLRYGQSLLVKSEEWSGKLEDPEYLKLRIEASGKAERILNQVIDENGLSCIVTVSSSTPSNLAAVSGACSMVIPAREVNEEKYDPLSFYMMAQRNKEGELIRLAYTLEKAVSISCIPSWLK